MKRQRQHLIIFLISLLLLISVTAEIVLVFNIASRSAKESGLNMLNAIRGEAETTITEAQNTTLRFAVDVSPMLGDEKKLRRFIYSQISVMKEKTDGECRNICLASSDFSVSPSRYYDKDEALGSDWYKGAVKLNGEAFVSVPYVDSDTGDVCYIVSAALGDKDTVVGLDFSLGTAAEHIKELESDGQREILLVTDSGIIAGSTNELLTGKNLVRDMPEYAGIFSLVKSSDSAVNIRQQGINYFAVKSSFGWSLIVSENNRTFYRAALMPIVLMSAVTIIMFSLILIMYLRSTASAKKAREDIEYRDKFIRHSIAGLKDPLSKIRNSSSAENIKHSANYELEFDSIRAASDTLSQQIKEILAYSDILRSEKERELHREESEVKELKSSRTFRAVLFLSLSAVLVLCVYINYSAATKYGSTLMESELVEYESVLSQWVWEHNSILDTYCAVLSASPDVPASYDATVKLLDEMTERYPEISASYLANPAHEPSIYSNSGRIPDKGYHLEEREWYAQTMNSEDGTNISLPYIDARTNKYCMTFSKRLYDAKTNEFLGVFAIDIYPDSLVDILGSSYSDDGYAFLADADGNIINHPYGSYQLSDDSKQNIYALPYNLASPYLGSVAYFRDYDGELKAASARFDETSHLSIYVVKDITSVYGNILIYSVLSIAALVFCMALVYMFISSLIKLQERTNRSLRESAESAIAADEAKSKFLAQMSHEIRTPINAVIGMNEMILRESTDNTIREYAVNIQSAGRTLLSLINSILDFSKIEDGKMEIIPVKYDTASMIHDLVTSITPRAKSKGLELIVRADATIPSALKGDDMRIKQIVSNLLTNAVKYTEKGSVTLIFKRENQHDDTIDLYIEVTDTGIGIKEEDLGNMFESFRRLEEKRNRNIEGTGLGMSIVAKLLSMMDSKLEVSSEYGKGSTFCFRLRQRIASPTAMGDYTSRIMKPDETDEDRRHIYAPRARVLIVDDNEMNIKVAVSMIKLYGIVPDTAGSGHEAIELCKRKKYHVIFMDHMMPILDGIETMKILKDEKIVDDSAAIIALTANAIVGAREMYLGEGFNDYLTKPIESRKFEKQLERYLPESLVTHRKVEPPTVRQTENKHTEQTDSDTFTMDELRGIHEKCPALDVMTGLGYCMDSKEFYFDTLGSYCEADKHKEMNNAFESGDIKNYGILAHSLKSTSKTVGAMVLSEHAKELEFAAKRSDDEYIKEHHEGVMTEYEAVLNGVREVLKNEQSTGS